MPAPRSIVFVIGLFAGYPAACTKLTPLPDAGGPADGDADADADTDADADGGGDMDASAADDGGPGYACDTQAFSEVAGCPTPIGDPQTCDRGRHIEAGEPTNWTTDPPCSGTHYSATTSWGEHAEPVDRGNWVHNLEHGGVVLLYRCEPACDAEVAVLRDVLAQRPDARIVLTPDPLLPAPRFAAVAWTWIYRTDAPDLPTLLCFVDQHAGHAPEGSMPAH